MEGYKEYIEREQLMDVREQAIWVYENANIINAQTIREKLKPLLDKIVDLPAVFMFVGIDTGNEVKTL